jgi:hypothetical protein
LSHPALHFAATVLHFAYSRVSRILGGFEGIIETRVVCKQLTRDGVVLDDPAKVPGVQGKKDRPKDRSLWNAAG